MGILSFIFGGGNIRIAAESIYNLYRDTGFNYEKTFWIRFQSLYIELIEKAKINGYQYYDDVYQILVNNDIRNLVNFALIDLNINAAPTKTTIFETQQSFSKEIIGYLVPSITKYNLNKEHFIGNNNHLTSYMIEILLHDEKTGFNLKKYEDYFG